jgi:hypothetical protein
LLLNRYGKVVHIVIFNFFHRARRLFVPFCCWIATTSCPAHSSSRVYFSFLPF